MRIALLAMATLLAATPATETTPAHAASARALAPVHAIGLPDGQGDVWTFSDTTTGYEQADRPAADVLRARLVHARSAVRVRMVFDDLQKVDTQRYYLDIRIPDGQIGRFVLEAKDGDWSGTFWQELEGEWVREPGISHDIDYAGDVVTLRVSRALLDRPSWVRVRPRNELGLDDGSTFFTDNPTTETAQPRFTRRLHTR